MIEIELSDCFEYYVDPFTEELSLGQIYIDGAYWVIDSDGQITDRVVIH